MGFDSLPLPQAMALSQFFRQYSRQIGLNWDTYRTARCDTVHLHTTTFECVLNLKESVIP
jgi:hypothetical protein